MTCPREGWGLVAARGSARMAAPPLLLADPQSSSLVVVADLVISVHRFSAAAAAFVASHHFSVAESVNEPNAKPIAAAAVIDGATGLRSLCAAFRAPAADGGARYVFGLVDVRAHTFICLARRTIDHARAPALQHTLADGPVLCVSAVGMLVVLQPDDADDEHAPDDDRANGTGESSSALLTVQLPMAGMQPTLLCTYSGDEDEEEGASALLLLVGAGGTATPSSSLASATSQATRQLATCPLHSRSSTDATAATTPLGMRAPALAASAASITCAEAQWAVPGGGGAAGLLGNAPTDGAWDSGVCPVLRVWAGMHDGRVLCFGMAGEEAPLCSISLPEAHMPLRAIALPLQHGGDASIIAVLCEAPAAAPPGPTSTAARKRLLLLNPLGETQRALDDVDGFLCHELLGCSIPQIFARRAAFTITGAAAPALSGYTLVGLSATFADVPASTEAPPVQSSRASRAHDAAVARRRQLGRVAAALTDRLRLGQAEVQRTRRLTDERRLLTAYAEQLLLAEAERASVHRSTVSGMHAAAADAAAANAAAADATAAGSRLEERWRAAAQLAPLQRVASRRRQPAPPAQTAVAQRGSKPLSLAPLRVSILGHGMRQGYWLLRLGVHNGGTRPAEWVSGALAHPSMSVHSHADGLRHLEAGASSSITMAVALPALLRPGVTDIDTLLIWHAPCSRARDTDADEATGDVAVDWRWQRCIGPRVRVDGGALFERALRSLAPAAPPTLVLPASLTRSVALVIEAPAGSLSLLELPRMLAGMLGLRPSDGDKGGSVESSGAALMRLPPHAAQLVTLRSPVGCGVADGCGVSTTLEARVGATGRCAELVLSASGAAHASVLAAAIRTVRSGLPSGTRLEVSAAGGSVLDCLRKASLAMQAELAGAASACEAFREAHAVAAAPEAAVAAALTFANEVGALQSATDAQMSVLHRLAMSTP